MTIEKKITQNTITENPLTYSVKATRKSNGDTWYIYNDWKTLSKEIAENESRGCNRQWGNEIEYVVIENK